jgi:hypothetical protein
MRNDEAEKVAETQEDAGFLAAIVGDGVLLPVFIVGLLRAAAPGPPGKPLGAAARAAALIVGLALTFPPVTPVRGRT